MKLRDFLPTGERSGIPRKRTQSWAYGLALAGMACVAFAATGQGANAQSWPAKEIKFIVAWPPGGGADVTARLFAEHMSKSLGQTIVVENRPGAGGTIGANHVIQAAPDGYTLLVGAISEISIAAATNTEMPFDTAKDLKPIVQMAKWNHLLVASPDFPPNSVTELVDYAKANPGQVSYGSWGANTLPHITGERLNMALGINARNVPFKGSNPSLTAVMGGHVQYSFDAPATTLGLIEAGKLKVIGTMGPERLPNAPDIPTLAEAGLPDFYVSSWIGLFAPKDTPQEIVDRLNKEVLAALEQPEVQAALEKALIQPGGGTPDDFAKIIQDEVVTFKEVAEKVGITQK